MALQVTQLLLGRVQDKRYGNFCVVCVVESTAGRLHSSGLFVLHMTRVSLTHVLLVFNKLGLYWLKTLHYSVSVTSTACQFAAGTAQIFTCSVPGLSARV